MNKYMILLGGKPAKHTLGDIGREQDEVIRVFKEDEESYIGNFEEGFGFVNVEFKKEDCRNLNQEEIDKLNNSVFTMNGRPLFKISIDNDGNVLRVST